MSQRKRKMLLAAVSVAGAANVSLGQTWVSTTGSWSDDSKWSAPPAPSPATTLMFPMLGAGSLAYTSTNDLPGPFTLDDITVQGLAGGSLILGSGGTSSLKFGGLSPAIAVSTGGNVLLNARTSVGGATPLSLTASPAGSITFAGVMRSAGLTINPGGTISLLSENRIRGNIAIASARLNLGNVNSAGDATITANAASLSIGPSTFATSPNRPPFFRNAITTTAGGLVLGDNKSFTLTGNISGDGGVTLAPTTLSTGTWTLAGNNSFNGPVAVIQAPGSVSPILNMLAFTGPAAIGNTSQFFLTGPGAAVGFMGGTSSYTINQNVTLNGGGAVGVFDDGARADITLAGNITGTGGFNRIGGGVLTLAGTNTFAGGMTIGGTGFTNAATDAQLGSAGQSITLNGGGLLLGSSFGGSSRTLLAGIANGTLHTDGNGTWSGPILNNGVSPGGFTKTGPGNLTLTNNTNSIGSLIINGGTVTAGGAAGRIYTTGSLAVNQTGALVLDNTAAAAARILNTAPMQLRGGTLRLIGNATVNTNATSTGQLAFGGPFNSGQGMSVVEIIPGATANALVRFGSVGRTANNGAHVLFTGAGLGEAPIGSLTAGKANVAFTTAPGSVNGILPYAIMDRGFGKELASYTAGNGIVEATYTSTTINNGTVTTNNVAVGSETILAAGTINAGKFTGGVVDLTAGTLNVTSGAILVTGATTFNGGTLTVGVGTNNTNEAPTANLFIHADTVINSRLLVFTNNGGGLSSGLAKSGPGVLTLSNTTTNYGGLTRILEGTLRLGTNNIVPNESGVVIGPGATLDMNGFNDTMGSLASPTLVNDVGSYPTGTLLLGAAALTIGAANSSTETHVNIVGTGTLVKSGTGTMTVIGDQAFSGVLTVANGTVALGTHQTTGTGMRNVARINVGTVGTSGEVGLRFENGLRSFDRPIFVQAQTGRAATLAFADGVRTVVSSPITMTTAQGLTIDAAGGPDLSGTISGVNFPLTTTTTGVGISSSRDYSLRISGGNTYTGATTLAADSTVWGNAQAFGLASSPILLGSAGGDDMPELSGDVGGLTLTRQITVQGSLNASANRAMISSRAPSGAGTITYSGLINISGSRSKLILFSNGEPLNITGSILGGATALNPLANVQIGHAFSELDVTTRGNVILSGSNNFAAGAALAAGTLSINGNTQLSVPGNAIVNSPVGTGTLTIGVSTLAVGHEPTIAAIGTNRTLHNPVTVTRNFRIAGDFGLTLNGAIDLGSSPKIVVVESTVPATFAGAIGGATGAALVKEGIGQLNLNGAFTFGGDLVVSDGRVVHGASQRYGGVLHVGPNATDANQPATTVVTTAAALSIDAANGGALDVANGGFVVDYAGTSPIAEVTAWATSGYNAGAWNGAGIHSTAAAADPGVETAVGVIEASDTGVTNLLGTTFTGDAVLVAHTLYGDSNLDRTVDVGDFALLANNFNQPSRWYSGDYNYSGVTDLGDFALLAANFNQTYVAPFAPRAAVPEPAAAGVLALVGLGLSRRVRTHRTHASE